MRNSDAWSTEVEELAVYTKRIRVSVTDVQVSSLGEDLLEESKDLGDVQLDVLEIEEVLVVLLLLEKVSVNIGRAEERLTFSNRSSILRSISRIAFSRPL
jgi:hypothetical protein